MAWAGRPLLYRMSRLAMGFRWPRAPLAFGQEPAARYARGGLAALELPADRVRRVVGRDLLAQVHGAVGAHRPVAVPALGHPLVRLEEGDQVRIAPVPPQLVKLVPGRHRIACPGAP